MTRDALVQEALKLTHAERADVAAELLASLDEEPVESVEEVERAWAVETERRARRVLSGGAAGRTWAEVKDRIERRLAESCQHPSSSEPTGRTRADHRGLHDESVRQRT